MDVCSQVAHTAIRLYVMGERAVRREPATAGEMLQMRQLVKEAIEAGAFGVTTSRHAFHRTRSGELAPVETADEPELLALARGLRDAGRGVFELIIDLHDTNEEYSSEFELMKRIVEASGRHALTFTLVEDPRYPDAWRTLLPRIAEANAAGLPIKGQSIPRPNGLLFGLDLSFNPFSYLPSYQALEHLPLAQRVAEMRKPDVRARILVDKPAAPPLGLNVQMIIENFLGNMVSWGDEPDYEPPIEKTIGYIAQQRGLSMQEVVYDLLLERDGRAILFLPASNFVHRSLDSVLTMMKSGHTLVALGDGGAHYGLICDASIPTFMLSYWARDRKGERLPLPWVVKALTRDTASIVGLHDRGVLAPGYKADINVIDFDRLRLYSPTTDYDLPGGGRRLQQKADGYVATIVNGEVTYREGLATGALPGRLVRSQ
jgi:N-acyl-D-aspartate/D-glutamate deacylase